jgi:hypothetical protein
MKSIANSQSIFSDESFQLEDENERLSRILMSSDDINKNNPIVQPKLLSKFSIGKQQRLALNDS